MLVSLIGIGFGFIFIGFTARFNLLFLGPINIGYIVIGVVVIVISLCFMKRVKAALKTNQEPNTQSPIRMQIQFPSTIKVSVSIERERKVDAAVKNEECNKKDDAS